MDSVAEVKVLMSAYSAENGESVRRQRDHEGRRQAVPWHGGLLLPQRRPECQRLLSNAASRPIAKYRYYIGSYTINGYWKSDPASRPK
jgi:hypothetical protein